MRAVLCHQGGILILFGEMRAEENWQLRPGSAELEARGQSHRRQLHTSSTLTAGQWKRLGSAFSRALFVAIVFSHLARQFSLIVPLAKLRARRPPLHSPPSKHWLATATSVCPNCLSDIWRSLLDKSARFRRQLARVGPLNWRTFPPQAAPPRSGRFLFPEDEKKTGGN